MKFLIALAIIFGLIIFFRNSRKKDKLSSQKNPTKNKTISMVKCEYCGVHLPENEAFSKGKQHWCSQEHLQLGYKPR